MKYAIGEVIDTGFKHVKNQVTLHDSNICLGGESYMDTACMVQFSTYFYYKHPKLSDVDFKINKIRILMLIPCVVGNPLVPVTKNSKFSYFLFAGEIFANEQ